jgi:Domain of unknown function (DUF4832)/Beta-galactosidase
MKNSFLVTKKFRTKMMVGILLGGLLSGSPIVISAQPVAQDAASPTTPFDITGLALVNASNGVVIRQLNADDTLSLADLGAPTVSIQAAANAGAKSVKIESAAAGVSRIEGAAPWAFLGNKGTKFAPWRPKAGTYTIKVTGYSGPGASGTAGKPVTITLNVVSASGGTTTTGAPSTTIGVTTTTAGVTTTTGTPTTTTVVTTTTTGSSTGVAHTYAPTDGPDRNPHKGWNSGWGNTFAESSVGFQYLKWKDFEPTKGSFNYGKVEEVLAKAGTKGQHFVLRLYCEWDGTGESDCPAWMYTDVGVPRLKGDNGKQLTDFNDPRYLDRAEIAIAALAAQYDTDPRVHAFQMGILGCWGEWHDCGFKQNGIDYEITDASKLRVLNAYKKYFKSAPIQGRYPWSEPLASAGFIGFHNDFFIPNNGHSNKFDTTLAAGGQWRNGPVGGEVPPRDGADPAAERQALFTTPTGQNMIETGHYSTMAPGAYRVTPGDANYDAYMRLHRRMGYNFRIDQAVFPDKLEATQNLSMQLDGRNVGVARLYYAWNAQFALLDAQGRPVAQSDAPVDLTKVGPNDTFSMKATLSRAGLAAGSYRLAVRLIQPGAGAAKDKPWLLDARNASIQFANNVPVIGAQWAPDNSLAGGWSVLGVVEVR